MTEPRFSWDGAQAFRALFPLRPLERLLFGGLTFEERWLLLLFDALFDASAGKTVLAVHPLSVPEPGLAGRIAAAAGRPRAWTANGAIAAALVPAERIAAAGEAPVLEELAAGIPTETGDVSLIASPWDLIARNAARIARDAELLASARRLPSLPSSGGAGPSLPVPADARATGAGPVWIGEGARIEPFVLLDASAGPIRIGARAAIEAHAVLRGPVWIRSDARVKSGGRIGPGTVVGEGSRVAGEVEETIFGAFSNKQHEGFLGHAVVGEWVNLGAGTNNSDLKNNYGTVRIDWGEGPVDTGLRKLGCFLGDHVKSAIGTRIGTGAVVGAASNLFGPTGLVTGLVPPFTWGESGEVYDLARAVDTMNRTRERRRGELERAGRPVPIDGEEKRRLVRLWEKRAGSLDRAVDRG